MILVNYKNPSYEFGDEKQRGCKVDPNEPLALRSRCPKTGKVITTYYIGRILEGTQSYTQLCTHLYIAEENEVIKLIINTPGGDVTIGQMIADAIKFTKAHVITVASGICASCGALIWSLGDELIAEEWARIMFHMSIHMDFGKTLDILDMANGIVDQSRSIYAPIMRRKLLTDEEYAAMVNDKRNIYITGKEMQRRLAASLEVA